MKPISCKEAVHYILKKEEGKLSIPERISLWRHLAVCSLCRIFSQQNKIINIAMKRKRDRTLTLSEEEKEHIIKNVLDEQDR